MGFSTQRSNYILIALVCLTSWAAGQEVNNMLEAGQMQAPVQQPQLSFDTFTGPGSSLATEAQQPFNTVAADQAATAAATGTGSATVVTDASNTVTDAAAAAAGSTVQPIVPTPIVPNPRPDNQLPTQPPNNGGRPPRPLPNPNQIPPGMNPLLALLKAILSGQGGIKVIGGGPIGGPGIGPMEDGPLGGPGGGFGGPFGGMGGPPRRIRIMILRKPRGGRFGPAMEGPGRLPQGLEGPGGMQGGFGGGYGGNGGGFGGGSGGNGGGFGGGSGEVGGGFGGRFGGMFN